MTRKRSTSPARRSASGRSAARTEFLSAPGLEPEAADPVTEDAEAAGTPDAVSTHGLATADPEAGVLEIQSEVEPILAVDPLSPADPETVSVSRPDEDHDPATADPIGRPPAAGAQPAGTPPAGTPPAGTVDEPGPDAAADTDPDSPDARPVENGATPGIRIEIDPYVQGGPLLGRFDLTIRGSVICPVDIESIVLSSGGHMISTANFGMRRQRADDPDPDSGGNIWHRFQFTLGRPLDQAPEPCRFNLEVRTFDDQVQDQDFEVVADIGAEHISIRIVEGPTGEPPDESVIAASAILYVERAQISDDGMLHVEGWALSATGVVILQVFAGDVRVALARHGLERGDVGDVYPFYPNSRTAGFGVNERLPHLDDAPTEIRVELLCNAGFGQELVVPLERTRAPTPEPAPAPAATVGRPEFDDLKAFIRETIAQSLAPLMEAGRPTAAMPDVPMLHPTIFIHCDDKTLTADGTLTLAGWAVCAAGIVRVEVWFDGQPLGLAEFGRERFDVGREYPTIPSARYAGYGLVRTLTDRIADGEHEVRVVAHNGPGDTQEIVLLISVTGQPTETAAEGDDDTLLPLMPMPMPMPMPIQGPSEAEQHEFRFEMDSPRLVAGAVIEPVTGRLTIEGWVLARSGIAGIDVHLDDQSLGEAHYGLARQDVGAAFADWPNAVRSGYAFHCPPRSLRTGPHVVSLVIRAENGMRMVRAFRIDVKPAAAGGDIVSIRRRVSRVEADLVADCLLRLGHRPDFTVLVRQGPDVDPTSLRATLRSLTEQSLDDWRVRILAATEPAAQAVRDVLKAERDGVEFRASVISPMDHVWQAGLVAEAVSPTSQFVILTAGDELGADALAELAMARALHHGADMVYGDEARISPVSKEREPFFKPDFSLDLLLSTNYIGRPWVATAAVFAATGVSPASLAADGEYDLVLRCSEQARSIRHVPKLLCLRGPTEADEIAQGEIAQGEIALTGAIARRGMDAAVFASPIEGTWRVKREVGPVGKVSIIIPTCAAKGYIETCINSLRARTAYRDYEIIVVDNIPAENTHWKQWVRTHADQIVDIPDAFNWSNFNNRAAEAATGAYLLFLNDDIEIEQEDWLDVLLEHVRRPEVAIVGPQLVYPDRKVQHAGMFLTHAGIARHAFRFSDQNDPGYFGLALTQRNVIAVTGACLLVRRETFDLLGGFDELHQITNNDLDFCLRAHRAGLLTVFTPYASLIHHELASRDRMKDVYDLTHFNADWGTLFAAGDPYFNPRLSLHADDYRPDDEPLEVVHAGNPMFDRGDIRRILVVKLDHIGDFITAVPSIRRLKDLFPAASITVLAGRAAKAFAAVEPAVDTFLEFEFFHARSGLGQKELTKDDYAALRERLLPYRFDLAIDLRKHTDTRDVLRSVPARYLAGFDWQGQFPFLDIALEWDGDRNLERKRSHVVDDLLSLVETVGKAARSDRTQIMLPPGAREAAMAGLPDDARALFDKPVVAIHPGVGTIMRQWPTGHFAALIDLLVERDGVNAVLIGGPDEADLAQDVLRACKNQHAVASLVGKTPLGDLPGLLGSCVLYVGNNSGPKHIAAALGVPTIGIHSGVVDAVEWGPIGKRAVALRRNMACSPCYLVRFQDCPRELACLRSLEPTLVHQNAEMLLAKPLRTLPPVLVRASRMPPADVGAMVGLEGDGATDTPTDDHAGIDQPSGVPEPSAADGRPGEIASMEDAAQSEAQATADAFEADVPSDDPAVDASRHDDSVEQDPPTDDTAVVTTAPNGTRAKPRRRRTEKASA